MLSCWISITICQTPASPTIIEGSTLVANKKLKDAAALIKIGQINAEKVKYLQLQVDLLNERLAVKDSIIKTYVVKDTAMARVLETYKTEMAILQRQKDLAAATVKKQNKLYRRQKRKTVFVAIAAPAVTAAAFMFLK